MLLGLLMILGSVIGCNYKCSTCDLLDSEKCLSCPPSRILNATNKCICKQGYQEQSSYLKSSNCFKCNSNCVTCSFDDPNICLSCGDPTTYRLLNNNKCECQEGYYQINTQYNCKKDFDSKILDFKVRMSDINNYHKNQIKQSITTQPSIQKQINSTLQKIIDTQFIYDPMKGVDYRLQLNQLSNGQLTKETSKESLNGEYYSLFEDNFYVLAIKQYHQPQRISWKIQINKSVPAQPFSISLNGIQYNFNVFQHLNDGNLLIQIIMSDGLPIQNRRILKFLDRQLQEQNMLYMQYCSLIMFNSVSILGNAEISKILMNFIALMQSCIDPNCELCQYDALGNEYCDKCGHNYQYNELLKQCVCKYQLDSKGQCYQKCNNQNCVSCVDNICIKCQDLTQNTCISCDDGYYQDGELCKPCDPKCKTCNQADICIDCATNYYMDNYVCNSCQSPCKSCLSSTQCQSCQIGYYYLNNLCLPCSESISNCLSCDNNTECQQCKHGYYLNSQYKCSQCASNCQGCKSNEYCTKCKDGYYLQENILNQSAVCSVCPQYCTKCKNSSQCTKCVLGYFEENLTCKICDSNCKTCQEKSNECFSCKSGQVLIEKKCETCKFPCQTCEQKVDTCITCIDDTYYLNSNNKCVVCENSCKTCTSNQHCLSCINGYKYIEQEKRCIFQDPTCKPSCKTCISSDSCSTCADGYFMDYKNECDSCSPDCSTCVNDKTYCTSCKVGYFLKNNACYQCDSKCIECISLTECVKCNSQYITNYQKKCELKQCSNSQCLTCYSENTCENCPISQYLDNNSCLICDDNCKSCTETATTCTSCKEGAYLDVSTKICKDCDTSCKTCKLQSTNCLSCSKDHFLSNNSCKKCSQMCLTCENSADHCKSCSNSQYLENSQCFSCSSQMTGCNSCDNSKLCNSCLKGYYKGTNNSCNKCPTECSECTSPTDCSQCSNIAYRYNSTTCVKCPPKCYSSCKVQNSSVICDKCADGYFQMSSNCLPCDYPCRTCLDNKNKCTSCQDGYSVSTNLPCQKCEIENCKQCSFTSNNSTCMLCMPDYELKSNQCILCTDNCNCDDGYYYDWDQLKCLQCDQTCSKCKYKPQQCTACKATQYLENHLCQNCESPCLNCLSSKKCTSCINGLQLLNNSCQSCQEVCFSCVDSRCTKCQDGYYSDQQSGQCYKCIYPCIKCTSQTDCEQCVQDKYLLYDNTCKGCKQGCDECNQNGCTKCNKEFYLKDNNCLLCSQYFVDCNTCTNEKCLSCKDSHYLKDDKCQKCIPNCLTCTQDECTACKDGYYQNQKSCNQCVNNCLTCLSDNVCKTCPQSYFLNVESKCQQCQENCIQCDNDSTCINCKEGYYLDNLENTTNNKCQKCQPTECTTCQNNNLCTKCQKGYFLLNNQCQKCADGCLECIDPKDSQQNQSECILCDENVEFFEKLENGICQTKSICNQLQKFTNKKGECQNCIDNCMSCENEDSCTKCIEKFIYNEKAKTCEIQIVEPSSNFIELIVYVIISIGASVGSLVLCCIYKYLNPGNELFDIQDEFVD